jgi:hypothetical protein
VKKPKLHRNAARRAHQPNHAERAKLCAEYGVPNTGRQWRKLRKGIQRAVRAAERDRPRGRKSAKQVS